MALYLVQHGKSQPKEVDPERGLTQEGIEETRRIADVAKGYRVRTKKIIHSGKKRALQTAEIFADALSPQEGVEEIDGVAPMDDVKAFAEMIDLQADIMVVGHLPFMEKAASFLVTGSADLIIFKFQNSGIVCLDKNQETNAWYIKWTLMPNIG